LVEKVREVHLGVTGHPIRVMQGREENRGKRLGGPGQGKYLSGGTGFPSKVPLEMQYPRRGARHVHERTLRRHRGLEKGKSPNVMCGSWPRETGCVGCKEQQLARLSARGKRLVRPGKNLARVYLEPQGGRDGNPAKKIPAKGEGHRSTERDGEKRQVL